MKGQLLIACLCSSLLFAAPMAASAQQDRMADSAQELNLTTATAEEGCQLAIKLARRAVGTVQPDKDVLKVERGEYSRDAESLIAISHVVALHFQTIAAANDYWRE